MGFGSQPFGTSAYGAPQHLPPLEVQSSLSSSRKIDGASMRYVVNDEGGFEAMDDTAQRVLLLVAFADVPEPFITPQTISASATRIRQALSVLTSGPEPAIALRTVDVSEKSPGKLAKTIVYRNLLTNTMQTVEPA